MEKDKTVASEILRQLGGNKFMVMTGSKCWTYDENSITFKVGRNAKGVNYFKVSLNGGDLYDLSFEKRSISKKTFECNTKIIAEFSDVFFDQLQELFTQVTGMYTKLF